MQTYFAKSIFVSKTFWVNLVAVIVAVLEESELTEIIPDSVEKYLLSAVALINIILRVYTVRPVAMVAPGEIKSVKVESL